MDGEEGTINSTVLPSTVEVSNSNYTSFSARIERDQFRWDSECLLEPDQDFLGGMSGGPVLLLNDPSFPLIGIVPEGNRGVPGSGSL